MNAIQHGPRTEKILLSCICPDCNDYSERLCETCGLCPGCHGKPHPK